MPASVLVTIIVITGKESNCHAWDSLLLAKVEIAALTVIPEPAGGRATERK